MAHRDAARRPADGAGRERRARAALSATSSRVHHFLLPAQGWGSATEVPKDVAALAPDAVAALKAWRRSMRAKPTKKQIEQLDGTR